MFLDHHFGRKEVDIDGIQTADNFGIQNSLIHVLDFLGKKYLDLFTQWSYGVRDELCILVDACITCSCLPSKIFSRSSNKSTDNQNGQFVHDDRCESTVIDIFEETLFIMIVTHNL